VAPLQERAEVECVAEAANRLGEGPCWDAASGTLYWLDIKGLALYWLRGGQMGSQPLPSMTSVVAPLASGRGLILASEDGLGTLEPGGGLKPLAAGGFDEGFRSNDGKVDPQGRFWWSAMDDDGGRRAGSVFRFDGQNRAVITGVHIANSMAFSPDGKTFYLSDSARKTIWAYRLDMDGLPAGRRVFAVIEDGAPDGAATDEEGGLWVAIWGGWRIDRYLSDGRLERSIPMPVQQPSSCIFGDDDLATLYVTSAWDGLSETELGDQPLAGGLFAVRPGVRGTPIPPFAD
jgi:sugar lactone lactonase YvrE